MKYIIALVILFYSSLGKGQVEDIFFVGHSLSDYIPEMLVSFGEDQGPEINYGYSQIIGSPLHYQWGCLADPNRWGGNFPDADIYAFYDPNDGLPTGRYEHLILNEGVPRLNNAWGIQETYRYMDSFYLYATQYRPDIKLYLCELWHCLLSGTPTGCDYDEDSRPWRQRLDDDLAMWESAIDFINDKYQPQPPAILIPSGQALASFYDSIEAGVVDGIHDIHDVFEDNIHGNDTIRYLVACVNYASVTKRSPIGLTNQPKRWWGGNFGEIPTDLALQLQTIAWETVCDYPHNGISCQTTSTSSMNEDIVNIYPNPGKNEWYLETDNPSHLSIFSSEGVEIYQQSIHAGVSVIHIDLSVGTYFFQLKSKGQIHVESIVVQP